MRTSVGSEPIPQNSSILSNLLVNASSKAHLVVVVEQVDVSNRRIVGMDRHPGQTTRTIQTHGMGNLKHLFGLAPVVVHVVDGHPPERAEFGRDKGILVVGGEVQVGGGFDRGDGLVLKVFGVGFGGSFEGVVGGDCWWQGMEEEGRQGQRGNEGADHFYWLTNEFAGRFCTIGSARYRPGLTGTALAIVSARCSVG